MPTDNDPDSWALRKSVWEDPRAMIGGSDAGAHLDLMCQANYTTAVLGASVRDRKVLGLEEAVRLLTDAPARLYGLKDRGRVAEGWHADLVVFDPATVGPCMPSVVNDLPSGARRLEQRADGFLATIVGGHPVLRDGQPTGALPGRLVRGPLAR